MGYPFDEGRSFQKFHRIAAPYYDYWLEFQPILSQPINLSDWQCTIGPIKNVSEGNIYEYKGFKSKGYNENTKEIYVYSTFMSKHDLYLLSVAWSLLTKC